jgi:hypothetical protein
MSYTLQNDPHIPGQKVLARSDKVVNCPFHPPMQVANRLNPNDVTIQYKGCGTWCALFRLYDNTDRPKLGHVSSDGVPVECNVRLECGAGAEYLPVMRTVPHTDLHKI